MSKGSQFASDCGDDDNFCSRLQARERTRVAHLRPGGSLPTSVYSMSAMSEGQSGPDSNGDIDQRAEAGLAIHASIPMVSERTGTLSQPFSYQVAPDLDLLEPDFFDDLRGDLEDLSLIHI